MGKSRNFAPAILDFGVAKRERSSSALGLFDDRVFTAHSAQIADLGS